MLDDFEREMLHDYYVEEEPIDWPDPQEYSIDVMIEWPELSFLSEADFLHDVDLSYQDWPF